MTRTAISVAFALTNIIATLASASTTVLDVPGTAFGGRADGADIVGPLVIEGDIVRVRATGLISASSAAPCDTSPVGYASPPYGTCNESAIDTLVGSTRFSCAVPCAPLGALVVGYDMENFLPWWYAGTERLFVAPANGRLSVAVNDFYLRDNQCSFTVEIEVNEALAPGEVPEILDLSCPCPPCGETECDEVPEISDRTQEILDLLQDEARFTDDGELQAAVDALASRLDAIEMRLDELDARQCEIIRLLLTPQGRRESDSCGPTMHFPDGKR